MNTIIKELPVKGVLTKSNLPVADYSVNPYVGKELFIGSVTDPYQPCESTYRRTRAFLEEMKDSGCRISIATKSDLVLHDIDLIKTFPDARISFSINTLDESFRTDMDCAVSIERRLAAMKVCHDAGIRTTCFISPIFPGITDAHEIISRAADRCNIVWLKNLNLRGDYKGRILSYYRRKASGSASALQSDLPEK